MNNKNVIHPKDTSRGPSCYRNRKEKVGLKKPMIRHPGHGKCSPPAVGLDLLQSVTNSFDLQVSSANKCTRKEKEVTFPLLSASHPSRFIKYEFRSGEFLPHVFAIHTYLLAVATPLQCFPVQSLSERVWICLPLGHPQMSPPSLHPVIPIRHPYDQFI